MSAKTADKDACLMEHFLSAETLDRIREFLDDAKTPPRRVVRKTAKSPTA